MRVLKLLFRIRSWLQGFPWWPRDEVQDAFMMFKESVSEANRELGEEQGRVGKRHT